MPHKEQNTLCLICYYAAPVYLVVNVFSFCRQISAALEDKAVDPVKVSTFQPVRNHWITYSLCIPLTLTPYAKTYCYVRSEVFVNLLTKMSLLLKFSASDKSYDLVCSPRILTLPMK